LTGDGGTAKALIFLTSGTCLVSTTQHLALAPEQLIQKLSHITGNSKHFHVLFAALDGTHCHIDFLLL
jgi:hypothetical protein